VYCQFDLIRWTELAEDEIRVKGIARLVRLGYASKVTLSTDTSVCHTCTATAG